MPSKNREAELNSLLAQSEQLYRKLQAIVPQLDAQDITSSPETIRSLAATIAAFLTVNCDAIERLFQKVNLDGLPQPAAIRGIEFYRQTLHPNRDRFPALFSALFESGAEIDVKTLPKESCITPVWNILVSGLDFWRQMGDPDDGYTEKELEAADTLLFSPFFTPDEWLQNANELQPVLGEKADLRIPSNVRQRLREVNRSFILGNYLASIALSRAILEYALVDRGGKLGIKVYRSDSRFPNRVRRLSSLVEDASKQHPDLKLSMERIVEVGNQTLHPKKETNLYFCLTQFDR